uniref:Uncharacterized protein n=1 Tax=Salix viminalis TaxID=40686 RepID=A0A6N2KHN8_SALVM
MKVFSFKAAPISSQYTLEVQLVKNRASLLIRFSLTLQRKATLAKTASPDDVVMEKIDEKSSAEDDILPDGVKVKEGDDITYLAHAM